MALVSEQMVGRTMAVRRREAHRVRTSVDVNPRRLVLLFVALFGVSLFYVWSQAQVLRATYALSRLDQTQRALTVENEKLELEIATLRSPTRLAKAAAERLNMVPPSPGQVVMVE